MGTLRTMASSIYDFHPIPATESSEESVQEGWGILYIRGSQPGGQEPTGLCKRSTNELVKLHLKAFLNSFYLFLNYFLNQWLLIVQLLLWVPRTFFDVKKVLWLEKVEKVLLQSCEIYIVREATRISGIHQIALPPPPPVCASRNVLLRSRPTQCIPHPHIQLFSLQLKSHKAADEFLLYRLS